MTYITLAFLAIFAAALLEFLWALFWPAVSDSVLAGWRWVKWRIRK